MGVIAKVKKDNAINKASVDVFVVDEEKLLWNQEAAILDTTELICDLMKEAGVSRSELARRMGTSKGNITQLLSGSRNLTIRTVSDLMTNLGHEFKASCKARFQDRAQPSSVVKMRIIGVAEYEFPASSFTTSQQMTPEFMSQFVCLDQDTKSPPGV